MPTRRGSIKLFRLFGITVYLHWSWFIAIFWFVSQALGYTSQFWSVAECLGLFLLVLMHEFGHQLACRSVGGRTHDIVLWPFGGVAYVSPPQRPGATLWSIAAGPLVNLLLFPVLTGLRMVVGAMTWHHFVPPTDAGLSDLQLFVWMLWCINIVLFVFNMLPIYPLDGGQILRSLLWFIFGRADSLLAASVIGFIGVGVLMLLAVLAGSGWLIALCLFIVFNCWGGLRQAQAMAKVAKAPRRGGFACPVCQAPPPTGNFWRCGKCRQPFDTFATMAICPHCATQYAATACPECGSLRPLTEWIRPAEVPPPLA